MQIKVIKKQLPNGLTLLMVARHNIPKVSTQLFYNVGSKDEKTGEKGLAHLIEHMIFKGTQKLSESDINLITQKLSGYCNAFTSYDYTGYIFDFPTQHWVEALPIMADCMQNCAFKEQLLNSELKAVIQELKMYNDDYQSSLVEALIGAIFGEHPYHHPIIGYKQDLWNVRRDMLIKFYQKHYIPNNATLVGVGDFAPEEFFSQAEKTFGHLKPNFDYVKEEYYWAQDLVEKSVTLYRDVQQSFGLVAWAVPGAKQKKDYLIDIVSWILGSGKGSRLYKKLVYETGLVTEVESFSYDLFDYGLFFIHFQPKEPGSFARILEIMREEVGQLGKTGPLEAEVMRAKKKLESEFLSIFEKNQKLAYVLGKSYLATSDEHYLTDYLNTQVTAVDIQEFTHRYLRPAVMNHGSVMPIANEEKLFWVERQQVSDEEDARVLQRITREAAVEAGVHVKTIETKAPDHFAFPKPSAFSLNNGLKVFFYHNPEIPKIEIILDLKAKYYYDPDDLSGLGTFLSDLLLEGTKDYTGSELADLLESLGMTVQVSAGTISMSMLADDLKRGLNLLTDMLMHSVLSESSMGKVRSELLTDLKNFWDSPAQFVQQIARQEVYKDHPYSKDMLGTIGSLERISRKDLLEYRRMISPREACIAIIGDLGKYDMPTLLHDTLGKWQGPVIDDIVFPRLTPLKKAYDVNYPMNRDQVVLGFAGLSVSRIDSVYDKITLFDQIFTGGVLGSMSSRLFELRERSGLFYTIGGSLVAHADKQPGIVFIRTIVSNDRLEEAETAIAETINHAADYITDDEFESARNALINSLVDNFATNRNIASSFIFLNNLGFPVDYFDHRGQMLLRITPDEVRTAAAKLLNTDHMVKIRIGRI